MRFSDDDIRATLQGLIDKASLRKVAKEVGVTPAFLSAIMTGKSPPGPKVAGAVGFQEDGLRWVRKARKR